MSKKILSLFIVFSIILSAFTFIGTYASNDPLYSLSFETDNENWEPWKEETKNMSIVSSDCSTEGSKSLLIKDRDTNASAGMKTALTEVKPGEVYTALTDIYLVSGKVTFYLRFYDSGKNKISDIKAVGTEKQWVCLALTETAPENAAYVNIIAATNGLSTGTAYLDNVRLVKGTVKAGDVKGTIPEISEESNNTVNAELAAVDDGTEIFSESFENGLGNWKTSGAYSNENVKHNTEKAYEGKASVYLVDESDSDSSYLISEQIPVAPSTSYTISASSYVANGSSMRIYVKSYDSNATQLESKAFMSKTWGGWDILKQVISTPANAAFITITLGGTSKETGSGYYDSIKVIKGTNVPESAYIAPKQTAPIDAKIVAPVNNKLTYTPYTDKGDKIGNFAYGGFYSGDYELPVTANLPVVATIEPSTDKNADDTSRIQEVINKVYNESSNNNMKVIKLKAGRYNINKNGIKLKSGIVLSGEGQSEEGTIIYANAKEQYVVVKIIGSAPTQISENAPITDEYVPSGSNKFNISKERIGDYKVGDLITIYHPSTVEWSKAIDMYGVFNQKGDNSSWKNGNVDNQTERTITAINGTEITVDFPVYVPIMPNLNAPYIYKTADEGRIENVGIENLRIESYYNGDPQDEQHATSAITTQNAKNCFVRDVSAKYFYASLISCGLYSKQITVQNCSSLEPVSKITGSRRYSFATTSIAQQLLYTGCYSYAGRHDYETSFTVTGPIVFLDSVADSSLNATETHGTWSTGVLYDNIYEIANGALGFIALSNRGIYGSSASQGWSAAGCVIWNSLSSVFIAHKPPLYQNFLVGTWGIYDDESSLAMKKRNIDVWKTIFRTGNYETATDSHMLVDENSPHAGDSYREASYTPVEPRSLYKAQLSEKYTGTIQNARPNAPIIVYPKYDKKTSVKEVTISGIYQLGASKVTVYIDNNPYEATLNTSDNTFSLTKTLEEGTHKIYATQTINGYESTKNADRFITIGKSTGNHDYLQSVYGPDKTSLLINDTRVTYDQYEKGITHDNDKISILVNDALLYSDVEPFETNGRVLVPMRAIFEEFKATVTWDEATATATAVAFNELTTVRITENQTTAYVNGEPVILDVPATIVNGRFVVPIRFISESFGAQVDWNDLRKTVIIKHAFTSDNKNYIPASKAQWSHCSADDKTGEMAIDGNVNTRWAGNGMDVWMSAEFSQEAKIGSFKTVFGNQDKRTYNFEIHFSTDGVNYTKVFAGTTTLNSDGDFYKLDIPTEAKFFKFVGKGGSNTDWMLLQEIEFYKE